MLGALGKGLETYAVMKNKNKNNPNLNIKYT